MSETSSKFQTCHQITSPGRKESSDRTARLDIPNQVRESWRTQSKSIRLALMLYRVSHYELSDLQHQYIANFQRSLNLSQISKALKFLHVLTTDPRTRDRLWAQYYPVPYYRERPNRLREKRRIGVGYRDKGSLPKNSKPSWDLEVNERAVSYRLEPQTFSREITPPDLENERPMSEEPAEDMSGEDRPPRSKFQSYYLPIYWSLELETLSVSEEIEGFTVPRGTENPSL